MLDAFLKAYATREWEDPLLIAVSSRVTLRQTTDWRGSNDFYTYLNSYKVL